MAKKTEQMAKKTEQMERVKKYWKVYDSLTSLINLITDQMHEAKIQGNRDLFDALEDVYWKAYSVRDEWMEKNPFSL